MEGKKKENKKFLGAFLKYQREQDGISLNYVADCLEINKGYLSEMENGLRLLSDKHLNKLMEFYDIPFVEDENIVNFLRSKLNQIYELYINLDEDEEIKFLDEILLEKEKYINSLSFFVFLIIELRSLALDKANLSRIREISNIIETFIYIYTSNEKSIYYDIMATISISNNEYDKAYQYLNLASSAYVNDGEVKGLYSMIMYHYCVVLQSLRKPALAFQYCISATNGFLVQHNYKRLFYCDIYKANCLSRMKLFKEAEKQYLEVYENSKFSKDKELQTSIFHNLAWNSLLSNEYIKCIDYTEKCLSLNSISNQDIFINIPYCYYKLGKYNECLLEISKLKKDKKIEIFEEKIFNALQYKVLQKKEEFYFACNDSITMCNDRNESDTKILLLKLLLDQAEVDDNKEKIIEIQRALILALEENI